MIALALTLVAVFGALCGLLGFYGGVAHMARSINRELEQQA